MKATKIFLMAALALIFAACSNDDNNFTTQPAETNGEITITATVSSNDGAMTRALGVDGSNIASTWKDTDKFAILYNNGTEDTKSVATVKSINASTVTITFTIPATLANNTACTIVYPASAAKADNSGADVAAALATQDGTIGNCPEVRVGTATIDKTTHSLESVTKLAAQNAIFKFTLGSAIDNTHPLTIKDNSDAVITTVTPTSSTTEVYVALEPATSKYYKFSATTADNKIISKNSTATIAAGKFYQTTLACPALGDLYYSDGTYSTTLQAGKTAIGVIAYLGTDNYTENGTNVGGSTFVGHGLVLCLKNAASGVAWSTENVSKFLGQEVTNEVGLKRTENVSGYTNTATLTADAATAEKYPAAKAAKEYTTLAAPAGTTGWFLPSAQQWVKMQTGLGALYESSITWGYRFDHDHTAADKWEAALEKAGSVNYDSMTPHDSMEPQRDYWSSSESSVYRAVILNVNAAGTGEDNGFIMLSWTKVDTYGLIRVRPVLAF